MIGAFRSSYCSTVPASSCSLSGPLLHRSPVVVYIHTYMHTCVYLISRFKISSCTADVDLLLLSLNKRNRNLQYNCHKAKL